MKDRYLLSIPKELKNKLKEMADKKGVSLNALIVDILWRFIKG